MAKMGEKLLAIKQPAKNAKKSPLCRHAVKKKGVMPKRRPTTFQLWRRLNQAAHPFLAWSLSAMHGRAHPHRPELWYSARMIAQWQASFLQPPAGGLEPAIFALGPDAFSTRPRGPCILCYHQSHHSQRKEWEVSSRDKGQVDSIFLPCTCILLCVLPQTSLMPS